MPAAAVIPAPIVYINAVAVKKLVVGSRRDLGGALTGATALCPVTWFSCPGALNRVSAAGWPFYFEKIRVLQAGLTARIFVHGIME